MLKNITSKLLITVNIITFLIGLGFLFGNDEEVAHSKDS